MLFFLFRLSLLFTVPYKQFHFSLAWVFEHVRARFSQLYAFLTGASSDLGITIYQYLAVILVGRRGRLSASAMILSGTVLSTVSGSVSRLLQYYMILSDSADPRIETLRDVNMGNFNSSSG